MSEDLVGRIFFPVIGIFMMLAIPFLCFSAASEKSTNIVVNDAIVKFKDEAVANGKISPRSYERMLDTINSLCSADVEITHYANHSALDIGGNVTTVADVYTTNTIREVMFNSDPVEDVDYPMALGDYLQIIVYNTHPTMATKMYNFVTGGAFGTDKITIYGTASGYVGNNPE